MKNKLLLILLIMALIITFTACSNSNAPTSTSNSTENDGADSSTENMESDATDSSTENTESNVADSSTETLPIILEDSAQWFIDVGSFKEYCQTEDELTYYNNYIDNLKPDWTDGTYNYHDLQGNNEIGIFITYWDGTPFNVYDDQNKTSVLCNVHGINFRGIYQCKETAYIYGYIKTTSDDYYDPFDFEGYGWVDPRELEDGYMISY